ncbi:MAG: hypothetical protein JW936_01190 [Sedimentisphaerales bacterium]|nr:hypothetical protein [Sedimentisphaerales bacterium]
MISKNTIIACLTVSAVIFACMLMLEMVSDPAVAQAEVGATSRAGYFAVCTAAQREGESLIWIANVNTQQMIVCERQYDNSIITLDSVDLRSMFGE